MPGAYYFHITFQVHPFLHRVHFLEVGFFCMIKRKLCLSSLNEEKFVAAISEPDATAA